MAGEVGDKKSTSTSFLQEVCGEYLSSKNFPRRLGAGLSGKKRNGEARIRAQRRGSPPYREGSLMISGFNKFRAHRPDTMALAIPVSSKRKKITS